MSVSLSVSLIFTTVSQQPHSVLQEFHFSLVNFLYLNDIIRHFVLYREIFVHFRLQTVIVNFLFRIQDIILDV